MKPTSSPGGKWSCGLRIGEIASEGIRELESQHREMRTLLLRIHSARVGMNEDAVIAALNDVDAFFREPNTN